MAQNQSSSNPRVNKLIELETRGVIKPEHQQELDTYRAQGFAPKKAGLGATREGEDKANAFLKRAYGANKNYEATGVGARSYFGQKLADNAPDLLNQLPGIVGNSPERQVSDSAQDEFIAASLRQDSGAAIPPEEMERQRRIYFPMPGEGAAVVAQKRAARMRALAGLIASGGRAVDAKQLEAMKDIQAEIDAAVRGDELPNSKGASDGSAAGEAAGGRAGQIAAAGPNTEEIGALDLATRKIDEAAGLYDGPRLTVDISGPKLPPEVDAERIRMLNDPNITPEQIQDYLDKNAPGWDAAGGAPVPIATERGENGVVENADALVRGAADVATLGFADELAAAGDTIFGDGTMAENLRKQRGVDRYDERNNPGFRIAGQIGGGLLLPTRIGAANATAREAAIAGGQTADLAALAGARAATKRGALESGGYAAGYGAGSGETLRDRAVGAGVGGVTGLALGAGIGKLSEIYTRRGGGLPGGGGAPEAPPPQDGDLIDVASRLNIRPTPATVGGRIAEGGQIGLGNAPGSMGPIRNAVEGEIDALGNAARDTAGRMGDVQTPQRAGEVVARGARVADRTQAREAGRLYNARRDMMGGDAAPVTMGGTQTALANIANDFGSNEAVAELLTHPLVRRLADADAGELTLGESTRLLSEARRVLRKARGKAPGDLVNQLDTLERAIEDDVTRAAMASDAIAGRTAETGAVSSGRQADRVYADRMRAQEREFKRPLASFGDDVNTSSESVYRQLFNDMADTGGNLVRLRRTLDRLPRRARDTFAASAFDDFGRATNSAQNAATDAWSFETFMTNWAKASDEAKRVVFGGRGVDREINDIVRYADRLRELNRARNFSNTAGTAANASYVTALIGSLFTGGPGAAAAVGSIYPAMNAVGRAFVSTPAARQWLRSTMGAAAKGNESQVRTLVRRLPSMAAKNPTIANEIGQFEQALLRAANDNVSGAGRVAAQPESAAEDK